MIIEDITFFAYQTSDLHEKQEIFALVRTLHYLNQWWVIVYETVMGISSSNFMKIVRVLLKYTQSKLIWNDKYRQVSNISSTLIGDEIVDHSDVVGASPVGAAPTTFSFST